MSLEIVFYILFMFNDNISLMLLYVSSHIIMLFMFLYQVTKFVFYGSNLS